MRAIDRVYAERQLLAAFDKEMGWADTDLFFKRMRIPRPDFGEENFSLKELTRGYLAGCSDDVLLDIAHQLGLDVAPQDSSGSLIALADSKYWLIDHFRVFISHAHTAKLQAAALRFALQRYAISAFVAHEDIETRDEWREEILRSLMSMDAFVAILTPDSISSKWTDQEVGIAVARDVLLIPISKGQEPYGFLSKYQALSSKGLKARDVAAGVFRTICGNTRTKGRMIESLTRTISTGSDASEVLFRIEKLNGVEGVGVEDWERVRENVAGNAVLRSSQQVLERLNEIFRERKLSPIEFGQSQPKSLDDEVPF
jgi:TIR domain-containing protein